MEPAEADRHKKGRPSWYPYPCAFASRVADGYDIPATAPRGAFASRGLPVAAWEKKTNEHHAEISFA